MQSETENGFEMLPFVAALEKQASDFEIQCVRQNVERTAIENDKDEILNWLHKNKNIKMRHLILLVAFVNKSILLCENVEEDVTSLCIRHLFFDDKNVDRSCTEMKLEMKKETTENTTENQEVLENITASSLTDFERELENMSLDDAKM